MYMQGFGEALIVAAIFLFVAGFATCAAIWLVIRLVFG